MRIIREIKLASGSRPLAVDFDNRGWAAGLVRDHNSRTSFYVSDGEFSIPTDWRAHVQELRWWDTTDIIVWPVSRPVEHQSGIGLLRTGKRLPFIFAYPQDVFPGSKYVICTYPEEQITVKPASTESRDLIEIFDKAELRRITTLSDVLDGELRKQPILEIELGLFSEPSNRFYFTAYDTKFIWCLNIDERRAFVGALHCQRASVIGIVEKQPYLFVLYLDKQEFGILKYDTNLQLQDREVCALRGDDTQFSAAAKMLHQNAATSPVEAVGYSNGRFAIAGINSFILFELG